MGVKIWDDWILTHIRKSEIEGGEWGKLYERWGRGAQTKKTSEQGVQSWGNQSSKSISSGCVEYQQIKLPSFCYFDAPVILRRCLAADSRDSL